MILRVDIEVKLFVLSDKVRHEVFMSEVRSLKYNRYKI
jgi:hypothetical protein